MKRILIYIVVIIGLISFTIDLKEELEYKHFNKVNFNNLIKIKDVILTSNNDTYQLELIIKNNSGNEYNLYEGNIEFYSDKFGDNEVDFWGEYGESVIPAGLEGHAIFKLEDIEIESLNELYLKIDEFDYSSDIIKVQIKE